jgi:hypothetical protein
VSEISPLLREKAHFDAGTFSSEVPIGKAGFRKQVFRILQESNGKK